MKISYNWLKDYIDIDLSPEKVADILTNIGLEVEGVEEFQSIKGGLEGVFVGEVITCKKHPNADNLSITTVDIGEKNNLQIICGAPNVAVGQKVPVAVVGTTLYKGEESLTLKKVKIRDEFSEGMICAEDELGLGNDHSGIMVLDKEAKPGTPVKDYFKIQNDTIFEIGLTPNRTDATCHYGVARDLAAFLNQTKKIKLKKPSVESVKVDDNSYVVNVTIENADSCPRYSGISVTGITVKPSPDWLQNKLKTIGLNPINNVVDITNFVLHETGQPLHAFDADKLKNKQIIVKNLPEDTKFTTLDEEERKLSKDDLAICDGGGPVALAGVFGGLDTGVTEKTKNIFIESAHFNPASTRRTARRHQLSTDSSFRFERGVDPNGTIYAMKRAALLIQECTRGKISSNVIDVYPNKIENKKVYLSYFRTDRLVGKKIDRNEIKNILKSLEFEIISESNEGLELIVPSYRYEVTREADVIEEILRIYGYNNVEITSDVHSTIVHMPKPDQEKIINTISDYLTANGFDEIMTNSLTKKSYYENLEKYKNETLVNIINPISSDLNVMRQSMLFGGLETILYNQNRKIHNLKLYEFGYVYKYLINTDKKDIQRNYNENKHLSLFLSGDRNDVNWISKQELTSFFELKTFTENILQRLGIKLDNIEEKYISNEIISEGLQIKINKSILCEYGTVNNTLLKEFDINSALYYADINWDNVTANIDRLSAVFKPLPKYPEVKRDLALLLDSNIEYSQIKYLALETEKNLLKRISLFDVYEGKNIEKNKKSYAISLVLQDENKTLTDKQIDNIINKLIKVFENKLGAKIR